MKDQLDGPTEDFLRRLRRRTALAGAISFVIPFGLFLALANSASERHVRKEIFRQLQSAVAANVELFDDVLRVRAAEVESWGQSLSRASSPAGQWPRMIGDLVAGSPWYETTLVADSTGEIVTATADLRGNIGNWEPFRQALGGQTVVGDVFFCTLTRRPEMVVATPIRGKHGGGRHVFLAAVKMDKLSSRLLNLGLGRTEESFLTTASGQLTSPSRLGARALQGPAFDPVEANPLRGEAGLGEYRNFRGQTVLGAYQKLRSKNYYLVAQITRGEIMGPVRELRRTILLYVAPFLALGIVLAAVAWYYAMNYIERLTRELWEALSVARQREGERDLALQELARRFEAERELSRQKSQFQAQLAEYEKYAALAQLALGAAHEINNPLLGILSHLELERKAATGEEQRVEIDQCIEGAKRISATVRGLLSYARPGPLQLSHVNLDRLVSDTLAFLHHHPLFRGIKIEKSIPADLPAITADANQLSQILMNLLLNSAEAMPNGGRVTIAAEKAKFEDKVNIRISDTGCGIAADVLSQVFQPFFTTKKGKGTGLGLSITQAYVRSHGGDIQVESIPQRGTSVQITLPIRQEGRPVPEMEEVIT